MAQKIRVKGLQEGRAEIDRVLKGWVRDSGGEVAQFFFSRKMRKYIDNKKNRCKKTCDSKPLSHSKTPDSNSRSKHDSMQPFCTYDDQIPSEFFAQLTC